MATSDFTITLSVDRSPNEAFNAINNVRGWWTEDMEGSARRPCPLPVQRRLGAAIGMWKTGSADSNGTVNSPAK